MYNRGWMSGGSYPGSEYRRYTTCATVDNVPYAISGELDITYTSEILKWNGSNFVDAGFK